MLVSTALLTSAASCTFPGYFVLPDEARGGGGAISNGNTGAVSDAGAAGAGLERSLGGEAGASGACDDDACGRGGVGGTEDGEPPIVVDEIPGLILAYSFDDANTTITDTSGHGRTGFVGDFDWVPGHRGNALALGGAFAYASLPTEGVTEGLNDFSVMVWTKPHALTTWSRVFDIGAGSAAYLTVVVGAATTQMPRFSLKIPGSAALDIESSVALAVDTWQLVSVTQAGDAVTFYIDGKVAGSAAGVPFRASAVAASRSFLGRSQFAADPLFDGELDEFRLYARALSLTEIKAIAGGAPAPAGARLSYDFDESSGDAVADATRSSAKVARIQTGVSFGRGLWGSAVQLDGVTGFVRLPPDVLAGANDFTVACFVNQTSLRGAARIFDFASDSENYLALMPNTASSRRVRFGALFGAGPEEVLDAMPLDVGAWAHVAVSRSGSTIRLYVEGAELGSRVFQGLPSDLATASNWLGRSHHGDPMLNAALDDFRIYDRALSAREIATLAAGP